METVLMNDNAIIPTISFEEPAGLDLYSNIKYWNLYISSRKFLQIYNR